MWLQLLFESADLRAAQKVLDGDQYQVYLEHNAKLEVVASEIVRPRPEVKVLELTEYAVGDQIELNWKGCYWRVRFFYATA